MEYQLVRSNRKTLAIHITPEAKVEARAPLRMPKSDIDRFIQEKQGWIADKLSVMHRRLEQKMLFSPDFGDRVLFCGKEYPIEGRPSDHAGFNGVCFYLPQGMGRDEIRETLVCLYKRLADKLLTQTTARFAYEMNQTPLRVRINGAKTHWGSCSGKNSINYSWRLALAPQEVIDYVVVHELAHMQHHNHSESFWGLVEQVLPDYQVRKQGLRNLQERLSGENWE